jgi:hypothetical protein
MRRKCAAGVLAVCRQCTASALATLLLGQFDLFEIEFHQCRAAED